MERSFAWLARYRRLTIRYERRADIHLACAFVCLGQIMRFCYVLSYARCHDLTCDQARVPRAVMRCGWCASQFQASQHALTMAS